jgi:hypothetical protein
MHGEVRAPTGEWKKAICFGVSTTFAIATSFIFFSYYYYYMWIL